MNKLKKLLALLLCAAMTLGVMPALALAEEGADTPPAAEGETITRAQWLSQLVEAFGMTVENDDDLPDNYFSDLDPGAEYYRDILVAVEFGIVDIEAGDPIHPDDPATREFAAQTLNAGMQFQLEDGSEYTFNEKDTVSYPDAIQIAINRGWLQLDNGNFLPEQPVTPAEAEAMFADIKAVRDAVSYDEDHENTYELDDSVIVIPEDVNIDVQTEVDGDMDSEITFRHTVTITDYDAGITEGSFFMATVSGIPMVFKALSVTNNGGATVIEATKDGTDSVIKSMDVHTVTDIDLNNFVPNEVSTFSVIDTTNPAAGPQDLDVMLQGVDYNPKTQTLEVSYNFSLANKFLDGELKASFSNFQLHVDDSRLQYKAGEVYVTTDTTVTGTLKFDTSKVENFPKSINVGTLKIAGIGKVSLDIEFSYEGEMVMSCGGVLKAGVGYDRGYFYLIKNFEKKSFSFDAEATLSVGVMLSLYVGYDFMGGGIWARAGGKIKITAHTNKNGPPYLCENCTSWLYVEVGVNVAFFGDTYNKPYVIFDEKNSPVRYSYHQEDSVQVPSCTVGNTKYTTPTTSKNYNPPSKNASSSYQGGGGSTGGSGGSGGSGSSGQPAEPVVIWKYDLDENNNATITGYYGNASALAIPSKIDGYKVTEIGSNVFEDNKRLRSVVIANSVTSIGEQAFIGCTNLSNIVMSNSLVKLGSACFQNCKNLTHLDIPKTLEEADGYFYDIFGGSGLTSVNIEDGLTAIPDYLFENAENLKSVEIPNSVTSIGENAFIGCTNLSNVVMSNSLVKLGSGCFQNCTNLTHIDIPKTLEVADGYFYDIFGGSGLTSVNIEDGLTVIPDYLFKNAENLKSVKIPDTITTINNCAFQGCSSLKTVEMNNNVIIIKNRAFENCSSLKEITIHDTVTLDNFGENVFSGCSSLTKVRIPDFWTEIKSNTFNGCEGLTDINLPSALTKIGPSAFQNCKSLDIEIPDGLETIEYNAFKGCDAFTEITIPASVMSLGGAAFMECQGLKKITVNTNCDISSEVFRNCDALENVSLTYGGSLGNSAFADCDKLRTVELNIGGGIGNSAFSNCPALEKAVINAHGGVGESAFTGCNALTSLTFGDGVTSIGKNACYKLELLSDIDFGHTVETIGDSAFRLCPALTTVKLPHFLKTIAANAFAEDTKLVDVYVPARVSKIENNSFSYPAKTTMHGRAGSYAEEYANSRSMTFDAVDAILNTLEFEGSEIFMNTRESVRPVLNMAPDFDTSIITFSSSDESIATVSETGVVTAKNFGDVVITAATDDGLETNIKIMIINPATSVTLNKNTLDLATGGSETLTITYRPNNSNDTFEWSSSNEGVARVDQSGNVTAIKQGEAVIIVKAVHGSATASCKVYVVPAEEVGQPRIYVGEITPGTDGKTTVEVDTANVPNRSTVFVTAFDENGNQIGFGKATVANDEATVTVPTENTKSIKVFCWESLKSMRPLCPAKEVEVIQ